MTDLASELTVTQTAALLTRYGFELKGYTPLELIEQWLRLYPVKWVRLAVVEALYQGRYKAISVEHILSLWLRRGQPTFHFTYDFERLIFRVLPQLTQEQFSHGSYFLPPSYDNNRVLPPDRLFQDQAEQNEPLLPNNSQETSLPSTEVQSSLQSDSSVFQPSTTSQLQDFPKNEEKVFLSDTEKEVRPIGSFGQPIHEFTPAIDNSDFYSRLKAVVKQDLGDNLEA